MLVSTGAGSIAAVMVDTGDFAMKPGFQFVEYLGQYLERQQRM